MERLYEADDWQTLCADDPNYLVIRTHRIPYGIFENTDVVTTGKPDQLAARLESVLAKVWCLNND